MKANVKGYSNLIKDMRTGAVINTDTAAVEAALARRAAKEAESQRIDELENRMARIEHLLERLVNGKPHLV